jgi:DMSO reductase anchor subunit
MYLSSLMLFSHAATAGVGWTLVVILLPQTHDKATIWDHMLVALIFSLLFMIPIIVASWLLGHQPNNFN